MLGVIDARNAELTAAWHQMEREEHKHAFKVGRLKASLREIQERYDSLARHLPMPTYKVSAELIEPYFGTVRWSSDHLALNSALQPEMLHALRGREAIADDYREAFHESVMPKLWEKTAAAINKAVGVEVFPPEETGEDRAA